MNQLLQKQVVECLGKTPGELPADIRQLLDTISKTYKALEDAKWQLQTLFENMQEGFFSMDMQTGQTLQMSNAAQKIWGFPAEDFYKNPNLWFERIIEEDRHVIKANLPLVQAGQPFSQQYRIQHKNGGIRWVEAKITPTIDTEGKPVRIDGMITDITGKKEDEAKLQASEEKFRRIVETAQEGIWTIDEYDKTNFVNKRICDLLEYSAEEMMGRKLFDFMDEEDKAYAYACMERRRKGAKETLDIRYLTRTGKHIWTNISANPIFDDKGNYKGALAMVTDITERKQQEELLRKSEANLRTIFNNTESSYILMDENLSILSFNSVAETFVRGVFAKPLREGECLLDYLPQERKQVVHELKEKVLEGTPVGYEVPYTKVNGTTQWFYMQWALVSAMEDKNRDILLATKDITEEKAIAEERERITADLIQRNKDLQHFTYVVSHNLRAPVANIMGLSNLLTGSNDDAVINRPLLNALAVSVKNLDGIIKDLNLVLQVRENISEKKEIIYFEKLVEEIEASIQNIMEEQNAVVRCNFSGAESIFSIRSYLYSIFYNLILNSIKYSRAGTAPVIVISSLQHENSIELLFEDNGKGIDLTRFGKDIFGLYKRFDTMVEGKGLGLFMVKAQVENLGGIIEVQSEVEKGTTFTIKLPAH